MGKVIVLGHGGFSQGGSEILVGSGQSITFYSDAGSPVDLPGKVIKAPAPGEEMVYGVHYIEDWEKVRNVIGSFKTDRQCVNGAVIYNYSLAPHPAASREVATKLDWGGTLVFTDGPLMQLCTDTQGKCPTPALRESLNKYLETNGEEGELVPEEAFIHSCDGILGTYKNDDISWVSCTGFSFPTPELPPEMLESTAGPGV